MGFWSGLGKVFKGIGKAAVKVAPVATAFIPGLGPVASALIGAGTGAASGAVTGGKRGALIGGLMGGVSGGAGSAARGASTAAKAASGGVRNTVTNIAKNLGTQAATGVGGRIIDSLLAPKTLETAGAGMAGAAQAAAHNRGVALDAMMAGDQNRMIARRDRAAEEADLWKKMQAVDYMKSGGTPRPTQPTLSANGKPLTQFSFGPAPISEGNKQMASMLEGQLMDRMKNPMKLSDYESKMNPGVGEQILNWGAPITTVLGEAQRSGFLDSLFNRNKPQAAAPTQTPIPNIPTVGVNEGISAGSVFGLPQPAKPRPATPVYTDDDWSNRG